MAAKPRRIFNYRPMVVAALSLVAGVLVGEALYGEALAWIALPLSAGAIALVLLLVFPSSRKYFYIPLALLVGFSALTASNAAYDSLTHFDKYYYSYDISATVSGMIVVEDGEMQFYVKDLYVDGERMEFDGKVTFGGVFEPDFNAGDIVKIAGSVVSVQHERFDVRYASAYASRVVYSVFANKIEKSAEGKLSFPENLQHRVKSMLYERLDDSSASICAALILGDKFGMEEGLKDSVKFSGLAHVLAVSGLHITTLSTALYFVLRKLKVKPWVSMLIVSALTLLYTAVCSFAASALRAFVMSVVFSFASGFGKKRDNLSALALAAILILSFRPTALFEAGFLFSFSSMLGIFLFHRSVNEAGQRVVDKLSPNRHIGRKVVELSAVSVSATLMSFPFVAYYIGYIPLFQLVSNLIFVPYVMVCYVLLLALTAFSLVTTWTQPLFVMRIALFPFIHYVNWVGDLSVNALALPEISVPMIVAYLLIAVYFSHFNLAPRKDKLRGGLIATASCVVVCAAMALI